MNIGKHRKVKSGRAELMQHKTSGNQPCDDCFKHAACQSEQLSCAAFNAWMEKGLVQSSDVSRKPTRELYFRIFPEDRKLFNIKKEAA